VRSSIHVMCKRCTQERTLLKFNFFGSKSETLELLRLSLIFVRKRGQRDREMCATARIVLCCNLAVVSTHDL
jgi:hypothetical protein